MRIPKEIQEIPWPELYRGGKQAYKISLNWPVCNHQRLLVITFTRNSAKLSWWGRRFRLICWKKEQRAAVLFNDAGPSKSSNWETSVESLRTCYPEISPKDETSLGKWLGKNPDTSQNHLMPELIHWVEEAWEAEQMAEAVRRGEILDDDVDLCPEQLPEGLVKYIRDTVLPEDNVLIYKKGNIRGVCFLCGAKVHATKERFQQGNFVQCPNCGNKVRSVLENGASWKSSYVANIAALQRGTDGKTVFIRQWHLLRDRTAQWEKIEDHLQEIARYAIRENRVAKWQHEIKENYYMSTERYRIDHWERMRNVTDVYDGGYYLYLPDDYKPIVDGTSLQYCTVDRYCYNSPVPYTKNPIRFLMDWVRYPAIEKFWKAGYEGLVYERTVSPRKTYEKVINWRKDTLRSALKFPTRFLKMLPPDRWTMAKIHRIGNIWEFVEAGAIKEKEILTLWSSDIDLESIKAALGHASVEKILAYVDRDPNRRRTYRDYLGDCQRLHLDLDDKSILFPKNLDAAHQRTIAQVKYEMTKEKKNQFAQQIKRIAWMEWHQGGLLIRLPKSGKELIDEGEYLHHCVGGYVNRMAEGKTTILLIRRESDPDTPFYTLEWMDSHVIQCRTMRNASYTEDPEVNRFVMDWASRIKKGKARLQKQNGRKTA